MNAVLDGEAFEPAQRLIDELAVALAEARGMPVDEATRIVRPLVAYLQRQYGGDEMYIPRPGRSHPVADILEATRRGEPVRSICKRFGISRRTYFNLMSAHR